MTQSKNDQDKKTEDSMKNTRNALDQDIQALSGKLSPEMPSYPANPGMSQSKPIEPFPKAKDLESKPKEPEKKQAELEAQVQQARGALAGDVKALSEKLSPDHLKEEAKDMLVEAKDAAVDSVLEIKDKVVDSLVEAKEVAVQKVGEATDVVAEKLHDYKEVATQAASDAGDQAMRAGRATLSFARQNAVPLAIIGIGASWLIASNRRSSRSTRQPPRPRRTDYRNGTGYRGAVDSDELDDRAMDRRTETALLAEPQYGHRPAVRATQSNGGKKRRSAISQTAERAGKEVEEVGEQAKDLAVRTGDRIADVYDRAGSVVVDRALRGRDFAVQQFTRVRDGSRELIRANPLAVGALAMATGIGIGMLLPSTRTENQLYGETRERLVGEARETAAGIREAAQGLSDVAKDTANTII